MRTWGCRLSDDVLDAGEVRLLAEIGYVAVGRGLHGEAGRLFQAVQAARPESAAAGIGRALLALSRGENDEAVRVLERDALRAEPTSLEARRVLALALGLAGRMNEQSRVSAEIMRLEASLTETAEATDGDTKTASSHT